MTYESMTKDEKMALWMKNKASKPAFVVEEETVKHEDNPVHCFFAKMSTASVVCLSFCASVASAAVTKLWFGSDSFVSVFCFVLLVSCPMCFAVRAMLRHESGMTGNDCNAKSMLVASVSFTVLLMFAQQIANFTLYSVVFVVSVLLFCGCVGLTYSFGKAILKTTRNLAVEVIQMK